MRRSQFSGPDNLDYFSGMGKLKMLNGLYFPGLRPEATWAAALLPLIERLVVYGVVEEESADPVASAPLATRLVAPLGEDAQRFRSLLREMTGREGAVIRGQLLASGSRSGRDRDEASAWRLTTALHQMGGAGGSDENLAKARAERIWQARLLLKLAEAVTSAETEISLSLAALAEKQAEMLLALQGGDEEVEPDEVLPVMPWSRPLPGRVFRVREQLSAWAVFYLLDPEPESLLLTDDPEAANLLLDEVEKRLPGEVISLPELNLGLGESARAALVKGMQEMLAGQGEAGRSWPILAEASQDRLASDGAPPLVLRLQLLPGPAFRRVMAQLSGLAGEDGDATALASPYVLLGSVAPR